MPGVVQFSHANGFPASSYRKMFDALAPDYHVNAIELIGHDPSYPVTESWPHLLDELLAVIDASVTPVHLVGHSLGGLLSIAAAYRRPERVVAVVVLDAPIFTGWLGRMFGAMKRLGLDGHLSPAASTLRRRVDFDSLQSAKSYLRKRAVFADLDEEVLNDYLGNPADDNLPVRLRFDATIESQIYRTIPHRLGLLARRPSPVPIGFIAGTRSNETNMVGLDAVYRLVGSNLTWVDGSHLFPLERPQASAAAIKAMLTRLLG